jgi:hypothetical protein
MTFTEYNKALIERLFQGKSLKDSDRINYILEIKIELNRRWKLYIQAIKEAEKAGENMPIDYTMVDELERNFIDFDEDAIAYYKKTPELLRLYSMSFQEISTQYKDK